jgi:hypothetical protein
MRLQRLDDFSEERHRLHIWGESLVSRSLQRSCASPKGRVIQRLEGRGRGCRPLQPRAYAFQGSAHSQNRSVIPVLRTIHSNMSGVYEHFSFSTTCTVLLAKRRRRKIKNAIRSLLPNLGSGRQGRRGLARLLTFLIR